MRSLVVGASGLVGSHVARALESAGPVERTALTRVTSHERSLDIRDARSTTDAVREVSPDVVVCAAAEPFVERCEREPSETAAINVGGTARLAQAAAAVGALFVFFSSDYVFDGDHAPYGEDDPVHPINEYGRQKVLAEQIIRTLPQHLVCRVSGVFGVETRRKNFVYQVVDRLRAGEHVRAAGDQVLCPTPADALGRTVAELIASGARGVYHVCGPDPLSRAEFARRVARAFDLDASAVEAVPSGKLGLLARRPRDSSLSCARLKTQVGHVLPTTDVALRELAARGID